ncbi:MAG: hypothetical protein IJI58_04220 [Bacilli bacterium]|nr:hypothetical protein [Bacilli bacterium]
MDDFKIGDDFDENGNVKEHKVNKKIAIIIVIVIAIAVGLLVFFVSNAIFGKPKEKPPVDTQVELNDENVQILYKYVAYKNDGYGNDKFLKENSVNKDSFNDDEKLYYALKFVQPTDLADTGQVENKQKVYSLTITKIKNCLPSFFGSDVEFNPPKEIAYKFSFLNESSVAKMTFDENEQFYKVVFAKADKKEELIQPVYTKLASATKKAEGPLVLTEKVIYTQLEQTGETYVVKIYKDYQHTTPIAEMRDLTKDQLKEISIDNYLDRAATVAYTFSVNSINKHYYFDNSSITY